jgi:hypothetical protein
MPMPGLVLVLPKSLAVTRKKNFMVCLQNYFNCSTLVACDEQKIIGGKSYQQRYGPNRVGTGCAMDYAGKYTVDVFSI